MGEFFNKLSDTNVFNRITTRSHEMCRTTGRYLVILQGECRFDVFKTRCFDKKHVQKVKKVKRNANKTSPTPRKYAVLA